MQLNRNEEYLLRFISGADIDNELLKIVSSLGIKPKSREYNPVYQIIDELNFDELFKKELTR